MKVFLKEAEGTMEIEEERGRQRKGVRENNMIVLSRVRRTSVLFCLQGLKSVVMIGGR